MCNTAKLGIGSGDKADSVITMIVNFIMSCFLDFFLNELIPQKYFQSTCSEILTRQRWNVIVNTCIVGIFQVVQFCRYM